MSIETGNARAAAEPTVPPKVGIDRQIARLNSAKTAIHTAITEKGVTVPAGTKLDGMAKLIRGISGGGEVVPEYDGTVVIGAIAP